MKHTKSVAAFVPNEVGPRASLGQVLGRLGRILGHLKRVLGRILSGSWAILGGFGGGLGLSWAALGPSWAHLGHVLGSSWACSSLCSAWVLWKFLRHILGTSWAVLRCVPWSSWGCSSLCSLGTSCVPLGSYGGLVDVRVRQAHLVLHRHLPLVPLCSSCQAHLGDAFCSAWVLWGCSSLCSLGTSWARLGQFLGPMEALLISPVPPVLKPPLGHILRPG